MNECHDDVVILPLTPAIAAELEQDASASLNGDGSCSAQNMRDSCFACEACRRGRGPRYNIRRLLDASICFVAVRTRGRDHSFVGCVSADPMGDNLLPLVAGRAAVQEGSTPYILSFLCVSGRERRGGVGRRLVSAVRAKVGCGGSVHLLVACNTQPEREDLEAVFATRVPRLLAYYGSQNFHVVASTPSFHLLGT